jgi:hypothetical protein
MLVELLPEDFKKVRPLFVDPRTHLAIYATIEGHCQGRIFVDTPVYLVELNTTE